MASAQAAAAAAMMAAAAAAAVAPSRKDVAQPPLRVTLCGGKLRKWSTGAKRAPVGSDRGLRSTSMGDE